MEDFFGTIYYYTNGLYSQDLDNYLFDTVAGYAHVGIIMTLFSIVSSIIFYYLIKPVRHQIGIWFGIVGLNALINFIVAIWYTYTPIINNTIDDKDTWTLIDSIGFGISNIMWSIIFIIIISFIIKWWSPAKYIPFKKF